TLDRSKLPFFNKRESAVVTNRLR
ncbi:unnamed protein product, partial [Rotaria sp. Silwood1]